MRVIRCCLVILLGSGAAWAAERPVQMKDLPSPVQATVKSETAGATVKGISRETEHGVTLYEVETVVNGLSRDILIDESGTVVEVEQQIAVAAAPLPVQQALSQLGQVLKLEQVTAVARRHSRRTFSRGARSGPSPLTRRGRSSDPK